MTKTLWCWRCKMDIPMLEDDEFEQVLAARKSGERRSVFHRLWQRREDIRGRFGQEKMLRAYNDITGFDETNPNAVYHHVVSAYGPPCEACGKVLRTPTASGCLECGEKRPAGNWMEHRTVPLKS